MVASLQVQATAAHAAAAQDAVNSAMKKALDLARAVPGVVATTNGYNVFKITPDDQSAPPKFQASQNLQAGDTGRHGGPPGVFRRCLPSCSKTGCC